MAPRASTGRRVLGSYYSPEPYARVLVRWALDGRPGSVLDPSFGGCAFLRVALDELTAMKAQSAPSMVFGADVDLTTAEWSSHLVASGVPETNLRRMDFLTARPTVDFGPVSAVVGNPPYVRHHWTTKSTKVNAEEALRWNGAEVSRRASLWAAFVVHSAAFVQDGGRMAMLLPSSALNADYAPSVFEFLARQFRTVDLVRLHERLFRDADEETVVLLADDKLSTPRTTGCIGYGDISDLAGLSARLAEPVPRSRVSSGSIDGVPIWKSSLLESECIELVNSVLTAPGVRRLNEVARLSLGVVTGANDFFLLRRDDVDRLGVDEWVRPALVKSSTIVDTAIESVNCQDGTNLLALPSDFGLDRRTRLGRYVSDGELRGLDQRRHCQRTPWWSLRQPGSPDAFLPYTVGSPKGIALNRGGLTSTNTIHHVSWRTPLSEAEATSVALSTWSTLGHLCTELFGRHCGGGVLKLELGDAAHLPVMVSLDTAAHASAKPPIARADDAIIASGLIGRADVKLLAAAAETLGARRRNQLQGRSRPQEEVALTSL